jgi:hypothetical protein
MQRRWQIAAGVACAIVLLVVLVVVRRGTSDRDHWSASEVAVASSPIGLEIRDARASRRPESTAWVFTVLCREPGGCRGHYDISISYRADGHPRRVVVRTRLELGEGESVECSRSKRGAERVEAITGVVVTDISAVDLVPDL